MKVLKAGCILVNLKTKEVGLVFRSNHYDYSFPKGHLEKNETLEQCAIRETEEETGRKCHTLSSRAAFVIRYQSEENEESEVHYFIATDDGKLDTFVPEELREELVWTPVHEVSSKLTYEDLKLLWKKVYKKVVTIIDNSMELPFQKADILLPNKDIDLNKWSVIACDQYTSDASYWQNVEKYVQKNPSTLYLTLPEIYLNDNVDQRIKNINKTMSEYMKKNYFTEYKDSMIYVERTQSDGKIREGLMGKIDLEAYDYNKGSSTLVRATEKTVLERIPPRVKVRENASLELPHIMILIDDPKKNIIESLKDEVKTKDKIYDFDLMANGGHLKGYLLSKKSMDNVTKKLTAMMNPTKFNRKYQLKNKPVLLFAMGDGNHSLATAKACYENLKKHMTPEEYLNHPARYALVEIVNLHSEALKFEAIHRVVFDINPNELYQELFKYYDITKESGNYQKIEFVSKDKDEILYIKNPKSNLAVGSIQMFLDDYLKNHSGKLDYIHGEKETKELGSKDNNAAFLFAAMDKDELFKTVILDGSLPRKTFSMGHADDKRFYLEARRIQK